MGCVSSHNLSTEVQNVTDLPPPPVKPSSSSTSSAADDDIVNSKTHKPAGTLLTNNASQVINLPHLHTEHSLSGNQAVGALSPTVHSLLKLQLSSASISPSPNAAPMNVQRLPPIITSPSSKLNQRTISSNTPHNISCTAPATLIQNARPHALISAGSSMISSRVNSKGNSIESSRTDQTIMSETPRRPSFNTVLSTAHPSLLLNDPAYLSTKLSETFLHYSRRMYEGDLVNAMRRTTDDGPNGDEERIEKKALAQLATDCVLSFLHAVRSANTWKADKWEKKEKEVRLKFIPGNSLSECVEIARMYLQQELQYKNGGVSKTMFFFHFSRVYKQMFWYNGKMTIERETLVERWNKHGLDKLQGKAKNKKDKQKEKELNDPQVSGHKSKTIHGKDSNAKQKSRKNRYTAPNNSIGALLAAQGLSLNDSPSKLIQADRKLKSTLSATESDRIVHTSRTRGV